MLVSGCQLGLAFERTGVTAAFRVYKKRESCCPRQDSSLGMRSPIQSPTHLNFEMCIFGRGVKKSENRRGAAPRGASYGDFLFLYDFYENQKIKGEPNAAWRKKTWCRKTKEADCTFL